MPSYGEFVMPAPLDGGAVVDLAQPVADAPAGTVCASCGNPNCPLPGGCS